MFSEKQIRRGLALSLAALGLAAHVQAQTSTIQSARYRTICTDMIFSVLTGSPDISDIASPKVIASIPNQAASYVGAIELGAPKSLTISKITHLSDGDAFTCRVTHEKGVSDWMLAYSSFTHSVEGISVLSAKFRQPEPKQQTKPATTTKPASSSSSQGDTPAAPLVTEACKKFPDLC